MTIYEHSLWKQLMLMLILIQLQVDNLIISIIKGGGMNQQQFSQQSTQALVELIQKTYKVSETEVVKGSEDEIIKAFQNYPQTIDLVFKLMGCSSTMDGQFKLGCATLLKSYYYKIAHKDIDKTVFVQAAYKEALEIEHSKSIRQLMATSLQHILNEDNANKYKGKVIENIIERINQVSYDEWTMDTLKRIQGLMLIAIACLNSLIQIDEICNYMLIVINKITSIASLCLTFIGQKIQTNEAGIDIVDGPKRIFEFIEIAFERIIDEEETMPQECSKIICSENLRNTILGYLHFYNTNGSIITPYYPLNSLKQNIMQILYTTYRYRQIPKELFHLVLITFLQECTQMSSSKRTQSEDNHSQQILCRCMQVLENHIKLKYHYDLFIQFKIQIIFAILTYSKTQVEEEQYILECPQKFVELGESYSEANGSSMHLKVRAACFLKAFVENMDEGRKILLELVVILLTGSISEGEDDSPIMKQIKNQFANYEFWGLSNKNKIDISLMVLTCLRSHIIRDRECCKIVNASLVTFSAYFTSITDELLMLRILRTIGYFPISIYFEFMKTTMSKGKVFIIEGLQAFSRIARNRDYLQQFPIIQKVFIDLVEHIEVGDSILEELIDEHYQNVIHKNQLIFSKIVMKLKMAVMDTSSNKHQKITSLRHLEELIRKEKEDIYYNYLLDSTKEVYDYCSTAELFEENLISIFFTILEKKMIVHDVIEYFVQDFITKNRLIRIFKGSKLFIFINRYLTKSDNDRTISFIFNTLMQCLVGYGQEHNNSSIIPYICFLLGMIVVQNNSVVLNINVIQRIVAIMHMSKGQPKLWTTLLFLQYLYRYTQKIRNYLVEYDKYYSSLLIVFQMKYISRMQRKIVVLSLSELIRHGIEPNTLKQMIRFCCNILYEQYEVYKEKPKIISRKQKMESKLRRMLAFDEDFAKTKQNNNDIQELENPQLMEDRQTFKNFKHTFMQICEFSFFKMVVKNIEGIKAIMDSNDLNRLSEVMYMEWQKDYVKKIIRVKR